MKTLILARHGESVYSAEHRANGDPTLPVPLTASGQAQATRLGEDLARVPIEACVTSAFPRTIESARIALSGRPIEATIDVDLNDLRYGEFEGQPLDRYHDWSTRHTFSDRIPGGGDSHAEVVNRCVRALERLRARPDAVILAVFHELLIADILDAAGHGSVSTPMQVEYATPYTLTDDEVARAVTRLVSRVEAV